jgi:hypothetical protein
MPSRVVRLAGQVTRSGLHTPSDYRGSIITAQPEMIQDKCQSDWKLAPELAATGQSNGTA